MRILLATPYYGTPAGGLENYVGHMAAALANHGWDVHIVTSGAPATTPHTRYATAQNGQITVHRLRTNFTLSNTPVGLGWVWAARRLIRELAPDVINVHAPVPSMALAVAAAAGQTPVVVTYHAGSMKKGQAVIDLAIGLYERLLMPWMLRRAKHIICVSAFVREQFLASWKAKSSVITPGVDTSVFTPASQKVSGQIIFAGDFRDPRKGLTVLLEAIKAVPEANLLVAGEGEPVSQPRVTYAGRLSQTELAKHMQSSHMLVLPSTTEAESFGMVIIEAMACGLPVIGSRIGGIPTVIEHGVTGLLVPAGDAKALAGAIRQLLAHPDLAAAYGSSAHTDALTYDWQTRANATHKLLTEVARG